MKSNVICMGDLFFNGFYPIVDFKTGGASKGVLEAIDHALLIADEKTLIVPGHGKVARRQELADYRTMFAAVRDEVAQRLREGQTEQEAMQADLTKPFDAIFKDDFVGSEFPRLLYLDLVQNGIPAEEPSK